MRFGLWVTIEKPLIAMMKPSGFRRRLVEVEGRVELENDLASALMNKGVALSEFGSP
jgi:hypothetical protein